MRIASLAVAAVAAFLAAPALACDEHAPEHEPAKPSATRPSGWITGEVRDVDQEDGTVALSHGRIAAWKMAPMSSMVLKTNDTSQLANLKVGDRVRFRAVLVGKQPTVTEIGLASQ